MDIKKSSIVTREVQTLKNDHFYMPTWGLGVMVGIAIIFVVILPLIYIKDPKRDGK